MCRRLKMHDGSVREEVMYSYNFEIFMREMRFKETAVSEKALQYKNNNFLLGVGESFFIDRVSSTLVLTRPFEAAYQYIQLKIDEKCCHKLTFSDFIQIGYSPERYLFFSSFEPPNRTNYRTNGDYLEEILPLQTFGFDFLAGPFVEDWSYRMEGRLLRPVP